MEDVAWVEETLVEMTYRWSDIELALPGWYRPVKRATGGDERDEFGSRVAEAIGNAFRVEAIYEEWEDGYTGETDYRFGYVFFFDVESKKARDAAQAVRSEERSLANVIRKLSNASRDVRVRVVSKGTPSEGQICGRPFEPPPKKHIDVTDVPTEKPDSNVPLTKRDGYWLTPIEVPFYDALRESALVFAVQPRIQGTQGRYRLDFLIFYDGGTIAVELDGHESHKTKEQRKRDAARDRWFNARKIRTLRWTGTEVHANPTECVRELLEIVRGRQARA
jgi:very-short-patch-repair endonuclease